jgi:hypothetical protein
MAALTRRVWAIYDTGSRTDTTRLPIVPGGSQQFLTGIAAAFRVRDLIQQALGVIMARQEVTADAAYLLLRTTAADSGATVTETAIAALREQQP